jgi:hypothetical protein
MNWTRFTAAFLFAPSVPALIFVAPALWMGAPPASAWSVFVLVSVVTYAHAIVLGVPSTFWLLSRRTSLTWLRVVVAAFLIGALPLGVLTLYQESTIPLGTGYEANGVVHRDNGRLTSAGLQSAVLGVLQVGGLGAVTGLVWWLIARPKKRKSIA